MRREKLFKSVELNNDKLDGNLEQYCDMQKKKKMCAFGGHIGVQDISEEYSQLL
jgi:hypothetical protein